MHPVRFIALCAIGSLFVASGSLLAGNDDLPDVTVEGLHRVPDTRMAVVYADPEASLAQYSRVKLLDAYVAFKKNWERDQRSRSATAFPITSKDVEKIKDNLAREFLSVFTETLAQGGYPVVEVAGDDVLLVRPAIINLNVTAPDTMQPGRSRTYVDSAGEMTLYVELYDSVTGDLLAKAMDRRADPRNNAFYTWSSSATNKAAADRILKGWADILLEALNEAKADVGPVAAEDGEEAESGTDGE